MSEKKIVKAETEKVLAPIGQDAINRAVTIANQLKQVIERQKLYVVINGKKYVVVEGWTTLGALLGLFPVVENVERINSAGNEIKYLATVAVTTQNGQILGRAFGLCSSKEKTRKKTGGIVDKWHDEYAIASMAQTRATSKVFRLIGSWIMKLAGYEPTPAEEIEPVVDADYQVEDSKKLKETKKITDAQRRKLFVLMKSALSAIIEATDITDGEVDWALKKLIDLKNASRQKASTIIEHLSAVVKGLDPDNKNPEYKAAAERFIKWYNGLQIEE